MIHDPLGSERTLRNSDEVVQKLVELRDYLWHRREDMSLAESMIAFKINSCLYEPRKNP